MIYIYGLKCPDSGEIRYIGKSENPKKRLLAHINSARIFAYDHHAARWLRRLDGEQKRPELAILHEVVAGEDWRLIERQWIARAASEGWHLTNSTAGGEGLDYLDPADQAKYKENHRQAMIKFRDTPEGKEQLQKMLRASNSPEVIARRSSAVRAAITSPEYREKMRSIGAEIGSRPDVKAKKSAKALARWRDSEKRSRMLSQFAQPECKKKQSESKIKAWADPVIGAKLRALHSSEEIRRKKSEGAKRRSTPEYSAMMAEKTRMSWAKRKAESK